MDQTSDQLDDRTAADGGADVGADVAVAAPPRRARRLVAAVCAAAVPVAVLAALALGGDDGADPEPVAEERAAADDAGDQGDGGGAGAAGTTGAPADGGGEGTEAAGQPVAAEPEVPSAPGAAGSEGDRSVVTYPQPTVPDGGCDGVEGTAVIELGSVASPGCVRVGADQALVFRNRTDREIAIVSEGLNEVVPAGGELSVGRAADAFPEGRSTFWSPGNPELSGLVERA